MQVYSEPRWGEVSAGVLRTKMEGGKCRCTQNQDGGRLVQMYSEPRWREVSADVLRTKMEGGKCRCTENQNGGR